MSTNDFLLSTPIGSTPSNERYPPGDALTAFDLDKPLSQNGYSPRTLGRAPDSWPFDNIYGLESSSLMPITQNQITGATNYKQPAIRDTIPDEKTMVLKLMRQSIQLQRRKETNQLYETLGDLRIAQKKLKLEIEEEKAQAQSRG